MNNRSESMHGHDPTSSENIKIRFDVLQKQLHDIYEEWGKMDDRSPDRQLYLLRHKELIDRESEVLLELRQLLRSADEVLGRTPERSQ